MDKIKSILKNDFRPVFISVLVFNLINLLFLLWQISRLGMMSVLLLDFISVLAMLCFLSFAWQKKRWAVTGMAVSGIIKIISAGLSISLFGFGKYQLLSAAFGILIVIYFLKKKS